MLGAHTLKTIMKPGMPQGFVLFGSAYEVVLKLLLSECGEAMTSSEMANASGLSISLIAMATNRLMKYKHIHISEWRREARYRYCAAYRLGPGKNVRKPNNLKHTEVQRRHRARLRACVSSVFDLGTPKRLRKVPISCDQLLKGSFQK